MLVSSIFKIVSWFIFNVDEIGDFVIGVEAVVATGLAVTGDACLGEEWWEVGNEEWVAGGA